MLGDLNNPCENTAAPGLEVNSDIWGFIQGRHNAQKKPEIKPQFLIMKSNVQQW